MDARVGHGRVRGAAALIAVVSVAGCAPAATLPSEAEALDFLDEAVSLAAAQRFEDLCDLGGGNCERLLADAGDPPAEPPIVVGTRTLAPETSGGMTSVGGIILELCGIRDDGPYYTEMLVWNDTSQGSRLRATEPVFWSGFGIATDSTTEPVPLDPAARCAEAAS
jgi:hypothetical protein